MTTQELREELNTLPPESIVVIHDSNGAGFHQVTSLMEIPLFTSMFEVGFTEKEDHVHIHERPCVVLI